MARDVVSAKLDIIFKKIFNDNKDMLHSFVADMLDVPQESISDIILTNSEIPTESPEGKFSRLDLNMKVDNRLSYLHKLCNAALPLFSYAVRMELISDNPCSKVVIPKGEVKEKQIYSQEEMELLRTRIMSESVKYKAFFFLIAYSVFRRSEMLGLEWKDIDFENNIISVRRTSNYTAERGTYTDTTKTKRSQRTLKISPFIMDILRELKDEQDAEALRLGDKWVETDRLFTKWNGEEMNNQTPYGWHKEFCKNNDLPFYGIHSFRHFAASSLISAGLDVTTVSGALGHCNSGTTLNLYCHQFQTAQARVSEAMDEAFGFLNKRKAHTA